jgi:plasmid stabilization system protein ParE
MTELIVLQPAEVEYNDALDWYSEQSESAADRFASEVEATLERIFANPDLFPH